MYLACEVPELWQVVHRMSGHVDRLRRLHLPSAGKSETILRDHAAILRAIRQGDADGAQQALRTHLSGTLNALDEIVARYPDFLLL